MAETSEALKIAKIQRRSGAQISLIQRETADSLRLNGRDITVNIVKVGGDDEEIQTKIYEVAVSGMNDSKKYVIKAVGIPCISEEIKGVRVSELAEQFDLPRGSVRRRREGTWTFSLELTICVYAHWSYETSQSPGC